MNSTRRFSQEVDYYDHILQKYQEYIEAKSIHGGDLFTFQEIIALIKEAAQKKAGHLEQELMKIIEKNTLVLLLSLFSEHPDNYYRDFFDLSENEKSNVKKQLAQVIENYSV